MSEKAGTQVHPVRKNHAGDRETDHAEHANRFQRFDVDFGLRDTELGASNGCHLKPQIRLQRDSE